MDSTTTIGLVILFVAILVYAVHALWTTRRRGGQSVSKSTLLVDAFDDGYNKGFEAGGGSVEPNEVLHERYTKDRKRWVR